MAKIIEIFGSKEASISTKPHIIYINKDLILEIKDTPKDNPNYTTIIVLINSDVIYTNLSIPVLINIINN